MNHNINHVMTSNPNTLVYTGTKLGIGKTVVTVIESNDRKMLGMYTDGRPEPYAVWVRYPDGFRWGHFFGNITDAVADFNERW